MSKFYALKKDVFDINKVTVVGSPTITSDGVASGFSNRNYIKTTISNFDKTKPYEILSPIFSETIFNTDVHYVFQTWETGASQGLRFYVRENRVGCYLKLDGQTSYTTIEENNAITINNRYQAKVTFTGVEYKFQYRNVTTNSEWMNIGAGIVESNTVLYGNNTYFYIGYHNSTPYTFINGSIDLTAFKIYVDNQLVFQPVKPTYLLERRKPKVWNKGQFTIVGNPSISDSGVASGFSSSNYVKILYATDRSKPWTQYIEFTTSSDVITQQRIWAEDRPFSNAYTSRFILDTNKKIAYRFTSDGASYIGGSINRYGTHTIQTNTKYILKAEFTRTSYNMYLSINGSDYELDYSLQSTDVLENLPSVLGFWSEYPFLGSIDLKQFKIYVDNNLVFDGGADTYVYDPSKFTIVGSPTITEYGIASGFSETSYIEAIKLLPNDKSWEAQIEYIVSQADIATTNSKYMIYNTAGDKGIILIWAAWNSNADYLDFIINEEGGTQSTVRVTSNTKFVVNDRLNITIGYDGQKYYQVAYKNDVLLQENYTASTEIVRQSDTGFLTLGARARNANYCKGSIDLPSFSVTVDGKEVFTGAKEQFYMLRR